MARSSTPTQACLSYLVGPGPMGGVSISMLRVGISNQDERVHALRVRLLVLAGDRPGRALAVAEWAGLLPRRSKRELEVAVDFGRRELRLEGRSSPFAANAESGGTGAHVV